MFLKNDKEQIKMNCVSSEFDDDFPYEAELKANYVPVKSIDSRYSKIIFGYITNKKNEK